jgi:hypothetical protein
MQTIADHEFRHMRNLILLSLTIFFSAVLLILYLPRQRPAAQPPIPADLQGFLGSYTIDVKTTSVNSDDRPGRFPIHEDLSLNDCGNLIFSNGCQPELKQASPDQLTFLVIPRLCNKKDYIEVKILSGVFYLENDRGKRVVYGDFFKSLYSPKHNDTHIVQVSYNAVLNAN